MSKKIISLISILLVIFIIWFFGIKKYFNNEVSYVSSIVTEKKEIKNKREKDYISIINFGDVMFDRGVRNIIENRGRDPFEYIKRDIDLIKDFDFIIANLEGPIVEMDRGLCQQKAYNFQFSSTTVKYLKSIGINMVTIANNHSFDCYRIGFESTKKFLKEGLIDYIGDSDLEKSFVIKEVSGKKLAFVGMDQTISSVSAFYPLVKKLKLENDFVIVNIHWGTEYSLLETKTQEDIAKNLIESGADIIFGHHPHVIEPVRFYKGKAIFYSLGNFVFDQTGTEETKGIGASVKIYDDKMVFEIFPYQIKLFAPDFMKDKERVEFCKNFLKGIKNDECVFWNS